MTDNATPPETVRREVDGVPLPNLVVREARVEQPISLHYRFGEFAGWAIFTVSAELCTFAIQSDWGDYSHRWPKGGCGDTPFLEWLARTCTRDPHYVTTKLSYGCADLQDEYDEERTRKEIGRALLEMRREEGIGKIAAREQWDDFHEILPLWEMDTSDRLYETQPPWAVEMFEHNLPIVQKRPASWTILQHALIPFFGEKLAAHLAAQAG